MPRFVEFAPSPQGNPLHIAVEHIVGVQDRSDGIVLIMLAVPGPNGGAQEIYVKGCAHDILAEIGD
jgi:hypothetical protein